MPTVHIEPAEAIELRKLRSWHWARFEATEKFFKTSNSTKKGVAARHQAAARTLDKILVKYEQAEGEIK